MLCSVGIAFRFLTEKAKELSFVIWRCDNFDILGILRYRYWVWNSHS